MTQTAVEFIVKELVKLGYLHSNDYGQSPNVTKVIKQAKEMEKQQIINANRDGVDMVVDKKDFISGEQYYKQKYGGNK
jgi:hypothetical protein